MIVTPTPAQLFRRTTMAKQTSQATGTDTEAKVTTDHDEIRRWVEARGGTPATVKSTHQDGDPGLLRIDFPGYSGEDTLEPISWDEFFRKFDEKKLAFLYQDERKSGGESRFHKFVNRETAEREQR
jgi:hypothetical protein